jgi:hypothetical protein
LSVIRTIALVGIALAATAATATVAHAYPQYQVNKEQTCAACHVSPAGGGLLDGMGPSTAEDEAMFGGDPGFLHGAVELPAWLLLGGDFRGATGVSDNGNGAEFALFPMQAELYGAVRSGPITGYATVGMAAYNEDEAINTLLLREHWIMYRSSENADPGFYARLGRFMPTYGLRQAEHPIYTRRYGGTPLYGETYGMAAGYTSPGLDAHLTVFMRDRLRSDYALERGDGVAAYAEKRLTETAAVGAELRYAKSQDEWRAQGGVTGKLWLAGAKTQLAAEAQLVRQGFDLDGADARTQLVGYLMASYQGIHGFWIDLGIGHYDADVSIEKVDRDAIDLNVHWFAQSHIELLWTNRYQLIGLGDGGDNSFYSLIQLHYRL